jgi:O-antigen/teichoic acid export membrane protein
MMDQTIEFILRRFPSVSRLLDAHMREVISGAAAAFVLKVIGAGLSLAFNVAVARLLGSEGAGLFFLALSITTIGSVLGRVGLDNTLLRFVATHAALGEWDRVKGVHRLGMRMAVAAAGAVAAICFLLAPWIASLVFRKPALTEPLRWMSLSILPVALVNLHAESLKGLKRIHAAMIVQGMGVPLVGLLVIIPLVRAADAAGAGLAYLAGTALTALLGAWAWRRAVVQHDDAVPSFPFRELWASCKPLLLVSVMNRAVLPWSPLFLLGIWAGSREVGIFGAASRVAMVVGFMLATVNSVLVPKFAELYARGDREALGRTARRSAQMITLLASPVFLILMFGGRWVMAIFGPEFADGALVLAVLAVGQLVNALTGSVNHVLIVTGNEKILRNTVVLASVVQIALCAVLIPWAGVLGAAAAAAAANAGINLAASYVVWKRLGIMTIPFLRAGAAAGIEKTS